MKKDKFYHHIKKSENDAATIALIGIVFLGLSVFAWMKPADAYSMSERRALKQPPTWSLDAFFAGSYSKGFEDSSVDQFPLRDQFRSLKNVTSLYGFGLKDVHDIYLSQGHLAQMDYPMNTDSMDRAARIFGNIYQKYLADTDVKTYFSVIPDKNAYMACESGHLALDYKAFCEEMQTKVDFAEYIDITELLELDDYYRTDSHWRQERIGDVAELMMSQMNSQINNQMNSENVCKDIPERDESVDLENEKSQAPNMENRWEYREVAVEAPFYGVYAGQSGLPVNGEDLIYLEQDGFQKCKVYDHEHQREIGIYDLEKASGKDPYELFLSGPISLITIENPEAKTDKELILFRDSFGSSIAPYFVEVYAKITLVDIRYLSSQVLDQWITFEGQDVLFLYSTQVLNHSETLK